MSRYDDVGSYGAGTIINAFEERDDLELWKRAMSVTGIDQWERYSEAISLYKRWSKEKEIDDE